MFIVRYLELNDRDVLFALFDKLFPRGDCQLLRFSSNEIHVCPSRI